MKLTLLGTGTPTPSLARASSGYVLEVDDSLILFDAGPGSYHRFLQTGMSLTSLTHVVFSHFHYDHCADFATFALVRWDQGVGNCPELKVFGPPPVMSFVESLLSGTGAFGADQVARTRHGSSLGYFLARGGNGTRRPIAPEVTELRAGDTVEGDNWSLKCVEVPHVQPYLSSLAFRVDSKDHSFCYSGDASYSRAFVNMAMGCDVLVHMCHRISGTELSSSAIKSSTGHMDVARIASEADARTCVLTHISDQMDVPGIPESLIREIGTVFSGDIVWGRDLLEVAFTRPRPRQLI